MATFPTLHQQSVAFTHVTCTLYQLPTTCKSLSNHLHDRLIHTHAPSLNSSGAGLLTLPY